MKRYDLSPLFLLAGFEALAVILWLTRDNIFYLFNFSYIGGSVALGLFLLRKKYPHARRVVQLLVGLYMLVGLGLIGGENMQLEGFWYYLFSGVFQAAVIHYAVAKIFGPPAVRPGLVRLRLLDGHGPGLPALPASSGTQAGAGSPAVCPLRPVLRPGRSAVPAGSGGK